jgi:hypothetical protein
MGNVGASFACGWGGKCPKGRSRFTDYEEEEDFANYGSGDPFILKLIVFYLVIALSVYAFAYKKSYLTPVNIGIAVVLLLITGGSTMR